MNPLSKTLSKALRATSSGLAVVLLCAALPAQGARSFNGSNQSIAVASALADVPMTFACWFRPSNITSTGVLMGVFATSDDGHYLMFRGATGGDPLGASSNDQGVANGEASTGTSGIAAGTWYHGAAVYTSTSSRAVFLNAAKFTNTTNVTPTGFTKTGLGVFTGSSDSTFFAGEIAEAAIWNVALTDAEVASLARGVSPLRVRPSALVFYAPLWRTVFDYRAAVSLTNSGTTAADTHPRRYR